MPLVCVAGPRCLQGTQTFPCCFPISSSQISKLKLPQSGCDELTQGKRVLCRCVLPAPWAPPGSSRVRAVPAWDLISFSLEKVGACCEIGESSQS